MVNRSGRGYIAQRPASSRTERTERSPLLQREIVVKDGSSPGLALNLGLAMNMGRPALPP